MFYLSNYIYIYELQNRLGILYKIPIISIIIDFFIIASMRQYRSFTSFPFRGVLVVLNERGWTHSLQHQLASPLQSDVGTAEGCSVYAKQLTPFTWESFSPLALSQKPALHFASRISCDPLLMQCCSVSLSLSIRWTSDEHLGLIRLCRLPLRWLVSEQN